MSTAFIEALALTFIVFIGICYLWVKVLTSPDKLKLFSWFITWTLFIFFGALTIPSIFIYSCYRAANARTWKGLRQRFTIAIKIFITRLYNTVYANYPQSMKNN